jgi:hypothetical protein
MAYEKIKTSHLPSKEAPAPTDLLVIVDTSGAIPVTRTVEVGAMSSGLSVLESDPDTPADGTWWVVNESGEVSLKVRLGGTTYVLAGVTLP